MGRGRVCPALSGTRHCRKSRSLAMCMVSLLSLAITVQGQAIGYGRGQPLEIQNQPVAPSPTRIACPGSAPRQPTVCHRTTRCPLLCASHDKREGVVRRQAVSLARRPEKRVGMRLATPLISAIGQRVAVTVKRTVVAVAVLHTRKRHQRVLVDRHLPNCKGRSAHSAGHTRPWPRKLCQPPDQAVRMMYASA